MSTSPTAPSKVPLAGFFFAVLAIGGGLAGYFLVWTPWLGALVAFAGPVLAIAGLASSFVARRRARRAGARTTLANVGAVANLGAGAFALVVALTCGTVNVIGSVAVTAVTTAPAVAAMQIDRSYPPGDFWGDPHSGYFWNPLGLNPGEQEDVVRRAVRHTVVSAGALLLAYVWLRDVFLQKPHDDERDQRSSHTSSWTRCTSVSSWPVGARTRKHTASRSGSPG